MVIRELPESKGSENLQQIYQLIRVLLYYQGVHTDLVGPIKPLGFGKETYFFAFTCDRSLLY